MSSISKQLSVISCSGKKQFSSFTEYRMVLLGKTGSGKSSTANFILGRKVFDIRPSSSSVTQRCRRACGEFRGRRLTLLDTPGLLDTQQTPQEVQRELRRSVSLLYPGAHVFLLIVQIGRFTQEEREVWRQIKQSMGSHALNFSVVVFTHGDLLEEGQSAKHCLLEGCKDLAELVAACGDRYCVFNNHSSKNKEQVSELFAIVDAMMQGNGGSCYCGKMVQKAEDDLAQELMVERKLLEEKEELYKNKLETAIKESHKKELEMFQQKSKREMEELEKKHKLEREKELKLVRDREQAFLRGMEGNEKRERERKIQEIVRVMGIRREEEVKREALQYKLDQATKMLEEQVEREQQERRAMEEKIQKDCAENEKKQRERELQQLQKEQAIQQREEMKRDALQKELVKLTHSLEEQSTKEEDRKKQMDDLLRREREENQKEREIQLEKQRAEKMRIVALQQELRLVKMKIEQQRTSAENLQRQLKESLRGEKEKCDKEMPELKKKCDDKCLCEETRKKTPAEGCSTVANLTGYAQEMGLLGLNAGLEMVGTSCCIQ